MHMYKLLISLKVIYVHHDLIFITLVWNDQQSFYLYHFHIIILSILFCQISIHCFIIELQYNHIYLRYDVKLYTILHMKSSHPNFELIMNANQL